MSYCRFSDASDVYVFRGFANGLLVCCACRLRPEGSWWGDWVYRTRRGMLRHLERHQRFEHKVPDYAIERLREEISELGSRLRPLTQAEAHAFNVANYP